MQRAQGTVAFVKGTQHAWLSAAVFIVLSLWILIVILSGWFCFHTGLKTRPWGLVMLRPGSQAHYEWGSESGLGPRTSDLRSRSLNHGARCSFPDSLIETDLCKAHALSLQTPWKDTSLFHPSPFLRGEECCVSLSSLPFSPGHKPELPWTGHIEGTAHTTFKIFRFPFNHSKWNCCTFHVPGHMPDNENSIRFPVTLCNFPLLVYFTAMIMTCKFCSFTCLFVLILEHKLQEVELFSVVFISISPKFRSMLDMF